jgi:hypothetical protein
MSKTSTQPAELLELNGDLPGRGGRPPIKLDSVAGVLEELAALYRAAKHGRIDPSKAAKLGYLLQILIKGHEVASLEARINALEVSTYEKP